MLTVDDALRLIVERVERLLQTRTERLPEALDHVLAEEIASDQDSPRFDKSIVDGYAVQSSAWPTGRIAQFRILEEILAGASPRQPVTAGTASRIMTGAPLPSGADAVVMIERATLNQDQTEVTLEDSAPRAGQNVLRRGASMRQGDILLQPGHLIRPIEIGLLAEVGRAQVMVIPQPRVAVISTGDELVDLEQTPTAAQIRNSNGPMLAAQILRAGGQPIELGVAVDDRTELTTRISQGLDIAQVVVLSGGVSAGVVDLVPGVLAELGIEQVFHKVSVKPGKPVWFGKGNWPGGIWPDKPRYVFGLPGNPVSSLVCFELFVRPALAQLAGKAVELEASQSARLTQAFHHRGDRPTYFPGLLSGHGNDASVTPLAWHGSADLRGLARANVLIQFPAGELTHPTGASVLVRVLT